MPLTIALGQILFELIAKTPVGETKSANAICWRSKRLQCQTNHFWNHHPPFGEWPIVHSSHIQRRRQIGSTRVVREDLHSPLYLVSPRGRTKFLLYYSEPVPIFMLQETRSAVEKKEASDIHHSNTDGMELLVTNNGSTSGPIRNAGRVV